MPETFDPYYNWLGISPAHQPPNHYQLLGLRLFEDEPAAIEAAAEERKGMLHTHQQGEHASLAGQMLNEISLANACLINDNRKAAYDRGLKQSFEAAKTMIRQPKVLGAEQFIDLLDKRDLLSAEVIAGLRKQVGQAKEPMPAASLAKRLVDAGHLTAAIAKRLLASRAEEDISLSEPVPKEQIKPRPAAASPSENLDNLELVPLDDEPTSKRTPAKKRPPAKPKPKSEQKPTQPATQQPATPAPYDSLLEEEMSSFDSAAADTAELQPLGGLAEGSQFDAAGGTSLSDKSGRKGLRGLFVRRRIGRKANQWDSVLMLLGGGGLLILVILLLVLVWASIRESGDDLFQLAEEQYRAGSYTQAIHRYNNYLEKAPGHVSASIARVRRGLSQLRQATARGTRDWQNSLKTAKQVLDEIAPEKEFNQSHGDLAVMLLSIAEGLAAQAQENPDESLVDQTNEAIDMMEKYVPKSLRRADKIAEIQASLALSVREIGRSQALSEAIAAMKKATADGNTPEAYGFRKALLKQYPRLLDDPQLGEALHEISLAQRDAVKAVAQAQDPVAAEPDSKVLATMVLTHRAAKAEAPDAQGYVVFAEADGSVYGLDAATGKVLWQRFVGFGHNGRSLSFPPTAISAGPGSDALLVDPSRHEVVRVEATTGQPRWRHPIGEPFDAHPVVLGDKILVATESGRLVTIDAQSGRSTGYVQLPQALPVAPEIDEKRSLMFQAADHSNLFMLDLERGQCKQVFHLGHEVGSLTIPPVLLSRYLMVVVNDRVKDSLLHVLAIEETDDGPTLSAVQQIRLKGHVDTPLLVTGRRVLVATDIGSVSAFEVTMGEEDTPLKKIAETRLEGQQKRIRFPLVQGGRLWIADQQFTRYDIQASRGQLVPRWIADEGSAFQQPPVIVGQAIVHVRRKIRLPGVLVSAVSMDEPQHYWETQLATPLAAQPLVDRTDKSLLAVTTTGTVFRLGAAELQGDSMIDQGIAGLDSLELEGPIRDAILVSTGVLAVSGGAGSKHVFAINLKRPQPRFNRLALPDPLGGRPIALGGGILIPTNLGQVFLLDPLTGGKLAEPFQPALDGRTKFTWTPPIAVAQDRVVLADRQSGSIFHLSIKGQPTPQLALVGRGELSKAIVSPVGAVGEVVFVVDSDDMLRVFQLPRLTELEADRQTLSGRCVWGPARVADHVMLVADDGKHARLLCLDGSGKLLWQSEFPTGTPAGGPAKVGEQYVLAFTDGTLWGIDAATGQVLGKTELGRPLGTGPIRLGSKLLLGGHDGNLYLVEPPQAE